MLKSRPYLKEKFSSDGNQTLLLRALMLMASKSCQQIAVCCVGAGDAFFRYWPKLREQVTRRRIRLTIADVKPLAQLHQERVGEARKAGREADADVIDARYEQLQKEIERNPEWIQFLDKEGTGKERYAHMKADVVFILVPDNMHIREARPWLKRATIVFIEKPYNRDLKEAQEFEEELRDLVSRNPGGVPVTIVIGIDHYLAKINEYLSAEETDELLNRIGIVQRIEFRLLESRPVEEWRKEALQAGMVYDLFVHILALISNHVDLGSFRLYGKTRILAAKHIEPKSPINGEDYVWTETLLQDFREREVKLVGALGKGVGSADEKHLVLVGTEGKFYYQLDPKKAGGVYLLEGDRDTPDEAEGGGKISDIGKGHPEILDALFRGRYIEDPVGGLPGNVAIQILEVSRQIRDQIEGKELAKYKVGACVEDINCIATVVYESS